MPVCLGGGAVSENMKEDILVAIVLVLLVVFCAGDPDLLDAIVSRVMKP